MAGIRKHIVVTQSVRGVVLALSAPAMADMQLLGDEDMADISGQSGITLEMELGMTADRLTYFDDDRGIYLEDFRVGSASQPGESAAHVIRVDITDEASLNLDYLVEDRRIEFGDIRLAGAPGIGMGGIFFDHSLQGNLRISPGGAFGSSGYTFDTAYTMTGGRLGYRTNGNEVFLDDITLSVEALGVTLDVVGSTLELNAPAYPVPTMWGQSDTVITLPIMATPTTSQLARPCPAMAGSAVPSTSRRKPALQPVGAKGRVFGWITKPRLTVHPLSIMTTTTRLRSARLQDNTG